jgi:hypothetical protein
MSTPQTTDIIQSPDPARDQFLKPGEGRDVRREDGSIWPVHGDWVSGTQFVRRRLSDGDLVKADPRQAARALKAEAEARAKAEAEAEEKAQADALAAAPPADAPPADATADVARKGRRTTANDE